MGEALRPAPAWFRAARAVIRRLPAGRFRAFNLLARASLPPFIDHLGTQAGGMAYRCDLRELIAREICLTGGYAPLEQAIVSAGLPAGGTFVVVGANLGFFTLFGAAAVGAAGRVLALEPHPQVAALLRENVGMNGLPHVRVLQLAASDAAGTATLAGFTAEGGNWGVSKLGTAAEGAPSFDVACLPLDQVLDAQGVDAVDLVKIDVEGAEPRVLRGMRDGLRAGRYRRVMVELHPWEYADFPAELAEIAAEMAAAGYRGWLIDESAVDARRAYYGAPARPSLRPLDPAAVDGTWPHVLWTLPGRELA
jgi:FkbM family methyltransferase